MPSAVSRRYSGTYASSRATPCISVAPGYPDPGSPVAPRPGLRCLPHRVPPWCRSRPHVSARAWLACASKGPGVPRAPVPGSPFAPPSRAHPCTTYRDPPRGTRLGLTRRPPFRAPPGPPVPLSPGSPRHELPRGSPVPGSPRIPRHKLTRGPPSRATRWSALPGSAIAPRAGPPRCPPSRDHPCTGPGFPRG